MTFFFLLSSVNINTEGDKKEYIHAIQNVEKKMEKKD